MPGARISARQASAEVAIIRQMRNMVIVVVFAGCCWFVFKKFIQKPEVQAQVQAAQKAVEEVKAGDTAATQYVESLQKDVSKADAAAVKAAESIQQTTSGVEDALKQADQ